MARPPGRGAGLALRLGGTFVAVAIAAIATLAILVLVESRDQVDRLASDRRAEVAATIHDELAGAYAQDGRLTADAAAPAAALARAARAGLAVTDAEGALVLAAGPGTGAALGAAPEDRFVRDEVPIVVDGVVVGTAELRFPAARAAGESRLESALARSTATGVVLAIVVAVVVGVATAGIITRPLRRLSDAARRLEAGDLGARAGTDGAPGELGELGRAFDRMADQRERGEKARRALVSDVSHELRTPVAVLQGGLEELVDGMADPSPERLASLHEEALRLGALVRDLEQLAAAEAPQIALDRRAVDLSVAARAAVTGLASQFTAKGVDLRPRLEEVIVQADPGRMTQVAVNLLANALKFTPEGGVVSLTVTREGDGGRLEVADTGPGIPADDLPHVFERFWHGASPMSGRGLGLAIVAELVERQGGRVQAASGPDGGARLVVTLPGA